MNDVEFENKEEADIGYKTEPSTSITKYIAYFLIAFLIFFSFIFFGVYIYSTKFANNIQESDDNFEEIEKTNISTKFNLTTEEYKELDQKFSIVDKFLLSEGKSNQFIPLYINNNGDNIKSKGLLPLNKISFAVSSSPKTAYLCKLYLDMWSTKFGSNIVKNTGIRPFVEVYWNHYDVFPLNKKKPFYLNIGDFNKSKNYKISLINQSSHHRKWFYMIRDNYKSVPSDVEWFVIADDDTLPFLDNLDEYLSKYKDPCNNPYFIHSPGDRISGTHLGNGGSGFFISRKLAEIMIPQLDDCMGHIRRRFYNGDIRLDHCIRVWGKIMPILETGLFHMDPKSFQGDLTGFVEGLMDRYEFKGLHHLEKKFFYLFPKEFIQMMENNKIYNVQYQTKPKKGSEIDLDFDSFTDTNHFSQVAHFVNTTKYSGKLFLKRYLVMLNKNNDKLCGILNFGYSFVVFSSKYRKKSKALRKEIQNYLKGAETTFTPGWDINENFTRFFVPKNKKLKRFYYKKTEKDPSGKNSYWQEYCSVSSPKTVAKIHVDDDQQITLSYFDYTYV